MLPAGCADSCRGQLSAEFPRFRGCWSDGHVPVVLAPELRNRVRATDAMEKR